ncbi:MAG TPA: FecR domain-containing protein, partial [Pyrinomonadaceae bacterium]
GLKLQEGDFIKSSTDSYAELLLQPGNYLRVGGETECQIFSDQHDKMRFKLNQGAISLEILANDWDGALSFSHSITQAYELIRVLTPAAEVFITQPGIFRINALAGGRTELIVRDGEAVINGQRVKKKRKAVASGDSVTIAEIDAKIEDRFDLWARERADKSVNANRLLKNQSPWAEKRNEDQETSVELPDDEEQSSSPFVVSAKPGAVNFVETGVEISQPTKEWQQPGEKSQLDTGDKLRTGEHSFVELTILPDMYLRLGEKSEVLFEQLSNESISVKLLRGSAILDVARFESKEVPPITLSGPSISAAIAREGNYRIDVRPSGDEITVRDGKVIFSGRSVGDCRTIARGTVYDCDKKRTDNFDFWSEHRGEGEFFSGRTTVGMASYLARLRRMRFKNTGFWFQNPGQTDYTFVPFTSTRFRSPYGGNYSTVLAPRRIPMNRVDMGGRPSFRFPRPRVERPQL